MTYYATRQQIKYNGIQLKHMYKRYKHRIKQIQKSENTAAQEIKLERADNKCDSNLVVNYSMLIAHTVKSGEKS